MKASLIDKGIPVTVLAGTLNHDPVHADDGGGWNVGKASVYQAFFPFEGKRIRVTIEVLD